MADADTPTTPIPKPSGVARSFILFGWLGFWLQFALAALAIAMTLYVVLIHSGASMHRRAIGLTDYLGLAGLAILIFTTLWSFRYTRLGKRMAGPDRHPTRLGLIRTLWIGIGAGVLGILVSLVLVLLEVTRLLFVSMKAPQGGVPVMQTETTDRTTWVSAVDFLALLVDLVVVTAELGAVALTLWLLFRVTVLAKEHDHTSLA